MNKYLILNIIFYSSAFIGVALVFSFFKNVYLSHKNRDKSRDKYKTKRAVSKIRSATGVNSSLSREIFENIPDLVVSNGSREEMYFDKITGTYKKEKVEIHIFPKITQDEKGFLIEYNNKVSAGNIKKFTKQISDVMIEKGLIQHELRAEEIYPYHWVYIETPPIKSAFSNPFDIDSFKKLVKPGKILLGQNQLTGDLAYLSLLNNPHHLFLGRSGSGKTANLRSTLLYFALSGAEIYSADGKGSGDLDPFSKFSPMKTAKPNHKAADVLVELQHMMNHVFNIYRERQQAIAALKEKTGEDIPNYEIYNSLCEPHERMRRIVVAIDELPAFVAETGESINKLQNIDGHAFFILKRLMKESRSFGFTLLIGSQSGLQDQIAQIPKQASSSLIGKVDLSEGRYLEIDSLDDYYSLPVGNFYLKAEGIELEKHKLQFIGDQIDLSKVPTHIKDSERIEFDTTLISTLEEEEILKMSGEELKNIIAKLFITEEGHEVLDNRAANRAFFSLKARINNKIYDFAFLDQYEFENEIESTFGASKAENPVVIVTGKAKAKSKDAMKERLLATFLFSDELVRGLLESFDRYKEGKPSSMFLTSLLEAPVVREELPEDLEQIVNMKGGSDEKNKKKGDALENWLKHFYSSIYPKGEALLIDEAFKMGLYPRPASHQFYKNATSDFGADLIVSKKGPVSEAKSEDLILIQSKNYSSASKMSASAVKDFYASADIFTSKVDGQKASELIIVNSNGKYTPDAAQTARLLKIKTMDKNDFKTQTPVESEEVVSFSSKEERNLQILADKEAGMSYAKIGNKYGLSKAAVVKICKSDQ